MTRTSGRAPARPTHSFAPWSPTLAGAVSVGGGPTGSVTVKVLPRPGVLSTESAPPWSSTNFFVSVRPRPVPSVFPVSPCPTCWNSSKIRS